jgi:hypothetical protein
MPIATDRIVGTWKYRDGFSEVEFSFSTEGDGVAVTVVDKTDDETPEIYDVAWSEDELVLRFSVLWSTGRFAKYSVAVGPDPDRVQATITSTWQELWERQ